MIVLFLLNNGENYRPSYENFVKTIGKYKKLDQQL